MIQAKKPAYATNEAANWVCKNITTKTAEIDGSTTQIESVEQQRYWKAAHLAHFLHA
jgi:hypothetical protein